MWRVTKGHMVETDDVIVTEHELEIIWNGRTVIRLTCTPEHLAELTGGFLLTSGYVNGKQDIERLWLDRAGGRGEVETTPGSMPTFFDFFVQSDGCMSRPVPRLARLDAVKSYQPLEGRAVTTTMLHLQQASHVFRATGGVHVAALARVDGTLAFVCEDIGRHNAVDKVAGMMMLHEMCGVALALSGRISTDIVQKAARMQIPFIISRSAPTQGAVELARECEMTLVGFARGQRFTIYSHPRRIISEGNP